MSAPQNPCRRCGVELERGKAIRQTYVPVGEDLTGDDTLCGRTLMAGGPGDLIDVWKCPACGYSRTMTLHEAAVRVLRPVVSASGG